MNIEMRRTKACAEGIFGEIYGDHSSPIGASLEHAYLQENGSYAPKVPEGKYTCIRGMHQLEGMDKTFETFQIMDVPGHSNILFHVGNYNADSSGCVLIGTYIYRYIMITGSKVAFQKFLDLQKDCDSFVLTVN